VQKHRDDNPACAPLPGFARAFFPLHFARGALRLKRLRQSRPKARRRGRHREALHVLTFSEPRSCLQASSQQLALPNVSFILPPVALWRMGPCATFAIFKPEAVLANYPLNLHFVVGPGGPASHSAAVPEAIFRLTADRVAPTITKLFKRLNTNVC
jgi:hypothetical protein